MAFAALSGALLAVSALPRAEAPPPPIIVGKPGDSRSNERNIALWIPAQAQCEGGGAVQPLSLRRPYNQLVWGGGRTLKPIVLRFSINSDGRPLSIAYDAGTPGRGDQAAAALASSRFAPGATLEGCTITYTPTAYAFDKAPRAELASYIMTAQTPRLPREGYAALHEGDECRPGTQPLLRAFPEFKTISATPGVRDWTVVRFGVTRAGVATDTEILASTNNAELDRAAAAAVGKSRFNAGTARANCSYPYWRAAAVLLAPPMPPKPEEGDERCHRGWSEPPRLVYPPTYKTRSIEGWAILGYDIAPWGQIGNVRVLDAQPTEDFGIAAKAMLERAKMPAGAGATGCSTRVLYKMKGAADAGDGATEESY